MKLPFNSVELFIGLRYTRAKRRNNFISFISFISMLGVGLGVMALIVVLSVMNGFENQLRERILGMVSHITISSYDNHLSDWQNLAKTVNNNEEIIGLAPYVEVEAMLSNKSSVSGAIVRGVNPEYENTVSDIHQNMVIGELSDIKEGSFGIVLGSGLADALDVIVGDRVTMITPQSTVSPIGVLPRLKRFKVVGIFEIGVYEYDKATAIVHAQDAGKLFQFGGKVSGLRLKLNDMDAAPKVRYELRNKLGTDYWVSDWTLRHSNYFKAIQTEKTVMFIILSLIVAVAAFNIVSTLVMVVTDKQADIAILRTIGMSPRSILAIFMIQGILIVVIGKVIGVVLGVIISLNIETIIPVLEQFFQTQFLPKGVYPITELPSDMEWNDVISIAVLSFSMSVLATFYPALKAGHTDPAEALRYE
jgi:lipoprotein-releasing system permease protein